MMRASGPQADHRTSAPEAEQRRPARTRRSRASVGTPTPVQPATSAATGTGEAQVEVLPRLLKVFGAIVAPTTLLTGLLFYFGRLHITGFFRYFRVNFTVLDLTVNDYLIRSADGLFRPVGAVTVFGLMALWLNRVLVERLEPGTRRQALRFLVPGLVVSGTLLLGMALADLLGPEALIASYPEAGGLGLAGGVLLLAYAAHLSRTFRPPTGALSHRVADTTRLAEWALAFLLLSIGLFWAVGSYAIAVGTGRAEQLHAELSGQPDAVLYSQTSLRLAVEGVTEVRCDDAEAAFRFRYDGLKLILQSGGQYLFVSGEWSRDNGTAVLLPRGDSIRVEFAPPGQQRSPIC